MDLCNSYFHVPIILVNRCIQGQAVQIKFLDFHLDLVPLAFSKKKVVLSLLMASGIGILLYLASCAPTKEQAIRDTVTLFKHIMRL